MKLKQIFETPIFIPLSPNDSWESEEYISDEQLKNCHYLTSYTDENVNIDFYRQGIFKIIGCVKETHPYEKSLNNLIIFLLEYKLPTVLIPNDLNNCVQIKDVNTDSRFGGRGIATFVYFNIMVDQLDYTVICDETHFFAGIKLWRKMARQSLKHNKEIRIVVDGKYICNNDGSILKFNDMNYPKSKIWSTQPNIKNKKVLLVIINQ